MIGLDLGASNCTAVLLDADGHVRAKASDGYKLQIPHPGWAEQDVRHVWEAVKKVLRSVAETTYPAKQGMPPPVGGICFSGAMHSLFPIADDAGTPIANAMTWADARATAVYRGLIADTDTTAWGWGIPACTWRGRRWKGWPTAWPMCGTPCQGGSETASGQVARLTGGITRTPLWAQIVADMLGIQLMALEVADTSATGAALVGMHALRVARTVEPGPAPALPKGSERSAGASVYSPDRRRHEFYKRHHRQYRALRRGMVAMGETLENLKESFL
jgi:sugar (pentulose or hexulose) kinase